MAKKAKRASKKGSKKSPVKKTDKKASRKNGVKRRSNTRLTLTVHSAAFSQLIAHAHEFQKSPLCYRSYPDGSAQVCKLMPDGTYGDCQTYDLRPVPGPRCG